MVFIVMLFRSNNLPLLLEKYSTVYANIVEPNAFITAAPMYVVRLYVGAVYRVMCFVCNDCMSLDNIFAYCFRQKNVTVNVKLNVPAT